MQEIFKNRRSVRKFKPEQVPDDLLDAVLEAGIYAPSAMNNQKTVLVAVRDKETRDQLSRMNAAVMGPTGIPSTKRPASSWCWRTRRLAPGWRTAASFWAT